MQTMAVSLAYMIYDLGCGLFEKQFKIDNSIHHLVSIIGFGAGLAYEKVRASPLDIKMLEFFFKVFISNLIYLSNISHHALKSYFYKDCKIVSRLLTMAFMALNYQFLAFSASSDHLESVFIMVLVSSVDQRWLQHCG